MKIEKINDNQIRCTLNKADLAARHLKISELAYGSDKAKALFRDMMQQASAELGFDAEDIPLMIEAIPVSAECIVLIVTKVDDPEELDTRFSRFSSDSDDDNDSFYPFDDDFDDFDTIENISGNSPAPTAADELDEDDNSDDVVLPDAKTANDVINLFSKVKEYLNKNIEKTTDDSFVPLKDAILPDSKDESSDKQNSHTAQTETIKPVIRIYSFDNFENFENELLELRKKCSILQVSNYKKYLEIKSIILEIDELSGMQEEHIIDGVKQQINITEISALKKRKNEIIKKNEMQWKMFSKCHYSCPLSHRLRTKQPEEL